MSASSREHWEHVYRTKEPTETSWYQPRPATLLKLLDQLGISPATSIVDIGGGASTLVDALLDGGVREITVLDIWGRRSTTLGAGSATAPRRSRGSKPISSPRNSTLARTTFGTIAPCFTSSRMPRIDVVTPRLRRAHFALAAPRSSRRSPPPVRSAAAASMSCATMLDRSHGSSGAISCWSAASMRSIARQAEACRRSRTRCCDACECRPVISAHTTRASGPWYHTRVSSFSWYFEPADIVEA